MNIMTEIESSVRCPSEVCPGQLEQGRWDDFPRCNTCLREFRLVETFEKMAKEDERSLRQQVGELQNKLDEIADIAGW